jgi:hypothetical protein
MAVSVGSAVRVGKTTVDVGVAGIAVLVSSATGLELTNDLQPLKRTVRMTATRR